MRINPHHASPASASTHPRGSQGRHRRMRGFTIIELMITLVVAAILLAIAIPSFTYLTVSNKLTPLRAWRPSSVMPMWVCAAIIRAA
ncbi:MAG: hypothetical protein B7X28_01135 [Halothiobacillus sp. 13-55-253]|nr:MAG: hypothetical protein B7X28_01135 [Halothiobacillus sp. 13-55-253]